MKKIIIIIERENRKKGATNAPTQRAVSTFNI